MEEDPWKQTHTKHTNTPNQFSNKSCHNEYDNGANVTSIFSCSLLPQMERQTLSVEKLYESCFTSFSEVDRQENRMIKNRESAARSRARKQAYLLELEKEANRLLSENSKLKKQNQKLNRGMAVKVAVKEGLQRTASAPF